MNFVYDICMYAKWLPSVNKVSYLGTYCICIYVRIANPRCVVVPRPGAQPHTKALKIDLSVRRLISIVVILYWHSMSIANHGLWLVIKTKPSINYLQLTMDLA